MQQNYRAHSKAPGQALWRRSGCEHQVDNTEIAGTFLGAP
jgi:hypothetical protein